MSDAHCNHTTTETSHSYSSHFRQNYDSLQHFKKKLRSKSKIGSFAFSSHEMYSCGRNPAPNCINGLGGFFIFSGYLKCFCLRVFFCIQSKIQKRAEHFHDVVRRRKTRQESCRSCIYISINNNKYASWRHSFFKLN